MYHTWVLTKGVLMNKISSNGLLITTSTFQYPHGWMVGKWVDKKHFKEKICVLGVNHGG
jgi:hypothetical protein